MKHRPNVIHPKNKDDFLSKHHCYPTGRMKHKKVKGVNLHLTIKLWRTKHDYWHILFRSATIDEIIQRLEVDRNIYFNPYYFKVFKCKRETAMQILIRIKQIKNH